ncbi:hypothetical protein GOQ04_03410 [Emticicia sp. ODNR4P]|nr:hypothetical protein [Emticicia sp. ODNR4P]
MYRLEIAGKFITLPTNFSSTIRKTNPYLSLKIVGDFAYQFTIPADEASRSIFGNVMFPYIDRSSQQSYPARLWYGNYLLFEGFANLRKANQNSYNIDLTNTPGNVGKSLYETSLRKLNLGSFQLETEHVTTGMWSIAYSAISGNSNFNTRDHSLKALMFEVYTEVQLKVDDKMILNVKFQPDGINSMTGTRSFFQNAWNSAIQDFNRSNKDMTLVDDGNSISVLLPDNKKYNVRLNIFGMFNSSANFQATQVEYDAVIQDKLVQDIHPFFCYPPARNEVAYDSGDWKNIINAYTANKVLEVNDYTTRTTYAISPAFKLLEVLRKVLDLLGYEMFSDIETHPDLKDILLMSTKNQDKQCPGTLLAFNIYEPNLVFADYMPDWTVKEFLENCKILYGVGIDFDTDEKKVYVNFVNSNLNQDKAQDISALVSYATTNNVYKKKNYQIRHSTNLEYDKYKAYPLDADLDENLDTDSIELKLLPAMLYSEIKKLEDDTYTLATTEQDYIYFDTAVQSPLFEQKDNTIEYRIFYAKGWKESVLSLSTTGTVDLQIAGEKGIYAQNSKLFEFLQQAEEFEASINLNPYSAAALNISKLFHAYNIHFFITELELKLPLKESSVFRFLRLGT